LFRDMSAERRARMVAEQLVARAIQDERVLAAMRAVPREVFVPARYRDEAYIDRPLPIGFGQTISQPYVLAVILEALAPRDEERVLEVGGGSGYSAAVSSRLAAEVVSIEWYPQLAESARRALDRVGAMCSRRVACSRKARA
jgi:protein-L-isoaspartate(D-aspartate) O-methyltransferase